MDTALVIISLLSLGLAGALLVYASKLQQEQRERSEARVAALRSEIAVLPVEARLPVFRYEDSWDRSAPDPLADTVTALAVPIPLSTPEVRADDGRRRLVAVVAIGVAAICALGATAYGVSATRARAASGAVAARTSSSLELVALRTTRSGDVLSVAGTLHNPATSPPQKGLVATVFVFDGAGKLLTSAQAPIDYQTLAADDDSPFLVKVSGASAAARVRVSFRQKGNVIPHVDRTNRQSQ
jgi:hypothetical protein